MVGKSTCALVLAGLAGLCGASNPQIQEEDFQCMFGSHLSQVKLQEHWTEFVKNLRTFGITDRLEIAALMGHMAHESAHLTRMKEYCADNAVSCPFNGYTAYPDNKPWCDTPMPAGKMYYGRGPLQLTWHCNYAVAAARLNLDLINDPDQVSDNIGVAHATAMLFWTTPRTGYLDKTLEPPSTFARSGQFNRTTDRINGYVECGSFEKQAQRVEYYQHARMCMGLPREPLNSVLYCGNATVPDFKGINDTCLQYTVKQADSFCEMAARHNVSGCCVIPNNTILDQGTLTDVGRNLHVDQEIFICPTKPGERICITPDIGNEQIQQIAAHATGEFITDIQKDFEMRADFVYGWATGYEATVSLVFNNPSDASNWQVSLQLDNGRLLNVFMATMVNYNPPVVQSSKLTNLRQAGTVATFNVAVAGRFSKDAIRIGSYSLTNITSPFANVDDPNVFIQIPNTANQISDLDPPQTDMVRFGMLYGAAGLVAFGGVAAAVIVFARMREIRGEEAAKLIDGGNDLASSVELSNINRSKKGSLGTSPQGAAINFA